NPGFLRFCLAALGRLGGHGAARTFLCWRCCRGTPLLLLALRLFRCGRRAGGGWLTAGCVLVCLCSPTCRRLGCGLRGFTNRVSFWRAGLSLCPWLLLLGGWLRRRLGRGRLLDFSGLALRSGICRRRRRNRRIIKQTGLESRALILFLGCRFRRHAELFSQWLHIHVTEDASRPREANAVETVLSTRGRDFVKQRSVAGQADDVAGLQNVQERIVLI